MQKDFVVGLDDFERKLIIVTVLSLVVVAIGILGTFLSKSHQLQMLSYIALGLNLNWLFGILCSNKVKKELLRIQHTNLNGQTGFEMLMIFCKFQIGALIFIYLFCLHVIKNLIVEVREMDVLALKDNGQLWANRHNGMPLQSVQAIVISFAVVQLLMMVAIMWYIFKFAQNGIQWSNK